MDTAPLIALSFYLAGSAAMYFGLLGTKAGERAYYDSELAYWNFVFLAALTSFVWPLAILAAVLLDKET